MGSVYTLLIVWFLSNVIWWILSRSWSIWAPILWLQRPHNGSISTIIVRFQSGSYRFACWRHWSTEFRLHTAGPSRTDQISCLQKIERERHRSLFYSVWLQWETADVFARATYREVHLYSLWNNWERKCSLRVEVEIENIAIDFFLSLSHCGCQQFILSATIAVDVFCGHFKRICFSSEKKRNCFPFTYNRFRDDIIFIIVDSSAF